MVVTDRRSGVRKFLPKTLIKFAITVLIVLLGGSYVTYHTVSTRMDELQDNGIRAMTEGTVAGLSDMIVTRDYTHLQETLRQSMDNRNIEALCVTDLKGKALSEMRRDSKGEAQPVFDDTVFEVPPKSSPQTITIKEGQTLIVWQKIDSSHHIGWLKIKMNTEQYDNLRRDLISTLAITIFVMIVIMAIIVGFQFTQAYGQMNQYEIGLLDAVHTDPLTKLPNRLVLDSAIVNSMKASVSNGIPFAVAFIDLDGFKQVNDTHGHDVGDKLLIEVASRFKKMLRDNDTVIRIGGDEFVLILNEITHADVIKLLNRIIARINQTYHIDGIDMNVGLSIGVDEYEITSTPQKIIVQADKAMYHAKRTGKNQVVFYKDIENDKA